MKRIAFAATLLACLGLASPAPADPAPRVNNPFFLAYASCADSKPFKKKKRCHYDGGRRFRATTVFLSKGDPVMLKACFRISGREPLGGRHACTKSGPVKLKLLPFVVRGVRQPFKVRYTWFAKLPGTGPFNKVGSFTQRVMR